MSWTSPRSRGCASNAAWPKTRRRSNRSRAARWRRSAIRCAWPNACGGRTRGWWSCSWSPVPPSVARDTRNGETSPPGTWPRITRGTLTATSASCRARSRRRDAAVGGADRLRLPNRLRDLGLDLPRHPFRRRISTGAPVRRCPFRRRRRRALCRRGRARHAARHAGALARRGDRRRTAAAARQRAGVDRRAYGAVRGRSRDRGHGASGCRAAAMAHDAAATGGLDLRCDRDWLGGGRAADRSGRLRRDRAHRSLRLPPPRRRLGGLGRRLAVLEPRRRAVDADPRHGDAAARRRRSAARGGSGDGRARSSRCLDLHASLHRRTALPDRVRLAGGLHRIHLAAAELAAGRRLDLRLRQPDGRGLPRLGHRRGGDHRAHDHRQRDHRGRRGHHHHRAGAKRTARPSRARRGREQVYGDRCEIVGKLYLVATPIGNLDDVSARALKILQEAHMVACEDTRHTQILLRRYDIHAKHLTSYTEFNHRHKAAELVGQLDRGWDVALVTDAGTPALSDPGEQLVRAAIDAGHDVVPIPGPNAAVSALVASGLPTRELTFVGFILKKTGERRRLIEQLIASGRTLVQYESHY